MCVFFNDTATTEIYTLSLHDALPIFRAACRADQLGDDLGTETAQGLGRGVAHDEVLVAERLQQRGRRYFIDRKSTRLNSSHANISYAVFCLKKNNLTASTCRTPTRAL